MSEEEDCCGIYHCEHENLSEDGACKDCGLVIYSSGENHEFQGIEKATLRNYIKIIDTFTILPDWVKEKTIKELEKQDSFPNKEIHMKILIYKVVFNVLASFPEMEPVPILRFEKELGLKRRVINQLRKSVCERPGGGPYIIISSPVGFIDQICRNEENDIDDFADRVKTEMVKLITLDPRKRILEISPEICALSFYKYFHPNISRGFAQRNGTTENVLKQNIEIIKNVQKRLNLE